MDNPKEVIHRRREIVKQWISTTLLRAGSNGKSVDQIADVMGLSAASLYKYASTNEEANQIHLHNLIPLINETGDFFILYELAKMFDFALVPLGDSLEMLKAMLKALEEE